MGGERVVVRERREKIKLMVAAREHAMWYYNTLLTRQGPTYPNAYVSLVHTSLHPLFCSSMTMTLHCVCFVIYLLIVYLF